MRKLMRSYVGLWRECFADEDPFVVFLARAQLICLNTGVGFALLMLLAWGVHFWRLASNG